MTVIIFRGQRVIEEAEDGSQKEETRKDTNRTKADKSKRLLVQVKSDIEHLANKVHHLKAVCFCLDSIIKKIEVL
jgi:hypothetical protein